ncbi:MAG: antA/AntB antirepressor family protein [Luteolibacter sp.]
MSFEIITIQENAGVRTVNARDLHEFLCVGRDFSNWIKERIKQYSFAEGRDFTVESRSPISASGNRGASKEYHITLDMAKELSMVERTHHGKLARQYFIDCEKRLLQGATAAHALPHPQLVELVQAREFLRVSNPMECAETLAIVSQTGMSCTDLVEALGCKRDFVYRHLTLLKLGATTQEAVRQRKISLNTANAMVKLPEKEQTAFVTKIQSEKLGERAALSLIKAKKKPAKALRKDPKVVRLSGTFSFSQAASA